MNQASPKYFDLSHFSLLQISGKDAFEFLHGQFTADLHQLKTLDWLFSAWCLPNGRVICTFIIFTRDNSFFLILPSMLKDKICKRLSMFILRSQVTLKDVSDDYALAGLAGTGAESVLQQITGNKNLPGSPLYSLLKLPDQTPRYILISKMEHVEPLLNVIESSCSTCGRADWSLLDIEAGLPWIINATSEAFLPQMLNLEQLHGLSYQKGCYPGQEVIARLHYRGQLKKQLYLGSGKSSITPGAGDRLIHKESAAAVGDVLDAELHPSGEFRLLAVVETQYAENDRLYLESAPEIAVTLQPVNYPA
jgi:folate-binding protein YgfZ